MYEDSGAPGMKIGQIWLLSSYDFRRGFAGLRFGIGSVLEVDDIMEGFPHKNFGSPLS
jgi:hypothetical protein